MLPTILPMDETHIEAIAALEKTCFSTPWSYGAVHEELTNPNAVFFVAMLEDGLAGYAGMYRVLDEGYLANLAVSPAHRRQGVASALMERLETYAAGANLSFLSLEVRRSNLPAVSLYKKYGYEQKGVRRNFYTFPTEDALIMTKFLHRNGRSGCPKNNNRKA